MRVKTRLSERVSRGKDTPRTCMAPYMSEFKTHCSSSGISVRKTGKTAPDGSPMYLFFCPGHANEYDTRVASGESFDASHLFR